MQYGKYERGPTFLEDEPYDRIITLSNGSKLHIKRGGRFGYYTVNYDKGQVPKSLQGNFTTLHDIMVAIQNYLNERNKQIA